MYLINCELIYNDTNNKATGAQAVHPGYGFLSENLDFCKLCFDNGIEFIGPPPNAIRAMGSKSESKDIMIAAKVPVTPGYHGSDQSKENLLKHANKMGYPVMIKAVSGGGGKGMRAVFEESKFLEALESCQREGQRSFNDPNVLIEKLIRAPRHVEVQVFGDKHGNAVHLMERDCSVQRRHQKVLEEAPAPDLSPELRKAFGDAAVACAKATGYVGAGTVEFLVDSISNDFYFCEMNTRLQVEHPVTEMISGTDLVEWQLLVASGHKLPKSQEEILRDIKGCAIEARIYAENPLKDFLPSTGTLTHMATPVERGIVEDGVRSDTGIRSGDIVSTFYDPMIGKLIAYGANREEALLKLQRALRDFQIAGLANNIDFLIKVSGHPTFKSKKSTTAFFEHHMAEILESLKPPKLDMLPQPVSLVIASFIESMRPSNANGVWSRAAGDDWRNSAKVTRQIKINNSSDSADLSVTTSGNGVFSISGAGKSTIKCSLLSKRVVKNYNGGFVWNVTCEVDGIRCTSNVAIHKNTNAHQYIADIWLEGCVGSEVNHYQFMLPYEDFAATVGSGSGNPLIKSPMPGKVVKLAKDGSVVKKGDTIVVLEAMKMEHTVSAPCDGIVKLIINEGATVSDGAKLAEVVQA